MTMSVDTLVNTVGSQKSSDALKNAAKIEDAVKAAASLRAGRRTSSRPEGGREALFHAICATPLDAGLPGVTAATR